MYSAPWHGYSLDLRRKVPVFTFHETLGALLMVSTHLYPYSILAIVHKFGALYEGPAHVSRRIASERDHGPLGVTTHAHTFEPQNLSPTLRHHQSTRRVGDRAG